MTLGRREAALQLAEDLLDDIELARVPPPDLVKKASRLARLLDDTTASSWLQFEMTGYPSPLTRDAVVAANRSGRRAPDDEESGSQRWDTRVLSQLQAEVEGGLLQIKSAVDAPVSISSANPSQHVIPPRGNGQERGLLRKYVSTTQGMIGKIVGAIHTYVAERELELRFGTAVESAFVVVRNRVDAQIARLSPDAALKIAAAFESASSINPEHWANAASACRRLLKALADQLRPPGDPVNNRAMTDDKYINRLVDWIENQVSVGATLREVIAADLADFGKRIDAIDDAGHKGAHSDVTQYEASRFITGAYLLIGDILALSESSERTADQNSSPVSMPGSGPDDGSQPK